MLNNFLVGGLIHFLAGGLIYSAGGGEWLMSLPIEPPLPVSPAKMMTESDLFIIIFDERAHLWD
jgi:hypothetical protein